MDAAQLLTDIRSLREETRFDSITPDRVGKILEYLLQNGDENIAAIVENIISLADTQTVLTDDNILSSLRTLSEIEKKTTDEIQKRILSLTDTQTPPSDTNVLSALRTLSEIQKHIISLSDTETELSDSNILSSLRTLAEIQQRALSRQTDDTAAGLIRFIQGLEIGNFSAGALGAGAALKMENGVSSLEVDKLTVRMLATFVELIISRVSHIGGQLVLTPARMKCTRVEEMETAYRCYFNRGENAEVMNEFISGDQARCQVFSGSGLKFYWRLVTSVGDDYIDLSKTDCASGSGIPQAGDDIVQLGNRSTPSRQSAQILSTVGSDAPSFKQYGGINSYSLEGKELTVFSPFGNKIVGDVTFRRFDGSFQSMSEWAENTSSDIDDVRNKRAMRIEKFATPGYDTFRENVPYSATLALKIFLDDIDETASMDIGRFVWMRLSENTAGDPGWSERHSNAGASIDITSEDLAGDTSFIVQFYDVENAVRYTTTF